MKRQFGLSAFILVQFVGAIGMFMLFYALFDPTISGFFETAIEEGGAARSQGAQWVKQAWTFGPALVLTMLSMHLLSRAVFESRGGV